MIERNCDVCGARAVYKDQYDDLCTECATTRGADARGATEEMLMALSFVLSRLTVELSNDEIRAVLDAMLADDDGERGEGTFPTSVVYRTVLASRVREHGWMTGLSSLVPRPCPALGLVPAGDAA